MQLLAEYAAVDEGEKGETLQEQAAVATAVADTESHASVETRSRWAFDIGEDHVALGPNDEGDVRALWPPAT